MLLALCLAVELGASTPASLCPAHHVQGAQRTPPQDPAAEKSGTGVIRGKVTRGDSGRGLRRAQIRVTAPDLAETTSTNTRGVCEVRDLPAGRYTVMVTRSGYLPMRSGAACGLRPDQSGTFRFPAVRPGEYLLIAPDYVQPCPV